MYKYLRHVRTASLTPALLSAAPVTVPVLPGIPRTILPEVLSDPY